MIAGVGADLCQVSRIAKALENERFLNRLYTAAERARLENLGPERRAERAAGMFAAKEAVAKALGTGFNGFGFDDIEILADNLGKPVVRLSNGAQSRASGGYVHISISHDGGYALAFAVLEREDRP